MKYENIVLLDRGFDATDSAYTLFKYIRKTYPDEKCFFAISKDSSYSQELASYDNVIEFKGKEYFKLLKQKTTIFASTHIHRLPPFCNCYKVFLQHGIINNNIYGRVAHPNDVVITSSPFETQAFLDAGINSIKEIGLARWDDLHLSQTSEKSHMIFFMPTWRLYLNDIMHDKEKFMETSYYQIINNFINSNPLNNILEKYHYKLIFLPHPNFECTSSFFSTTNKNVIIEKDYSKIQEYIRNADMAISDYSSILMDFSIQKKPIFYMQYDYEEFRENHYSRSLSYSQQGMGPVFRESDNYQSALEYLERLLMDQMQVEDKYIQRIDKFFTKSEHYSEDIYQFFQELETYPNKMTRNKMKLTIEYFIIKTLEKTPLLRTLLRKIVYKLLRW